MSARRPIDTNELPLRRVPTRPVRQAAVILEAPFPQRRATISDVPRLLVGELGMGVDVAADGGDLAWVSRNAAEQALRTPVGTGLIPSPKWCDVVSSNRARRTIVARRHAADAAVCLAAALPPHRDARPG